MSHPTPKRNCKATLGLDLRQRKGEKTEWRPTKAHVPHRRLQAKGNHKWGGGIQAVSNTIVQRHARDNFNLANPPGMSALQRACALWPSWRALCHPLAVPPGPLLGPSAAAKLWVLCSDVSPLLSCCMAHRLLKSTSRDGELTKRTFTKDWNDFGLLLSRVKP